MLTEPCHLILKCWPRILSYCFTTAFQSRLMGSSAPMESSHSHLAAAWHCTTRIHFPLRVLVKGFCSMQTYTPSGFELSALSAAQCQHPENNTDSPCKGLTRAAGTCFHFFPEPFSRNTDLPESRSKVP